MHISRTLLHRVYRIIKRLLLVLVVQYFYMYYIITIISIHSYAQIEQLVVYYYDMRTASKSLSHRVCACPHHAAHRRISWYLGQTRGRSFDFGKRDLTKYDVGLRITRDDDDRCGLGAVAYANPFSFDTFC